jgi:hypothetical protein
MLLVKRVLSISILLLTSSAFSEEITTYLDCNVMLNTGATEQLYRVEPDGTKRPIEYGALDQPVQFELVITTSENRLVSVKGGKYSGASIHFNIYDKHLSKVVRDDSSESKYSITYEALTESGRVWFTNKFSIHRYSGAIEIDNRSSKTWGTSKGRCKVMSSKAF